jgi:branched-subunit amino acid aminotransferase/4-amino-4-deoxychorismate lyase
MEASRLAAAQGADEALLVRPDGVVLEAPTSTIFWVSEGRLRTPALDVGILASITRDRLVRELDVEEGTYPLDDLEAASEAFLASTVREVQAISAVNETKLADCPGKRTQEAAETFSAILDRELAASASS